MTNQVELISAAAEQVTASSDEMVKSIEGVSAITEQTTAATEEMSASNDEVQQAMDQISQITEQSGQAIEECSASTEELTSQVDEGCRLIGCPGRNGEHTHKSGICVYSGRKYCN